jgi:hypothetical protein
LCRKSNFEKGCGTGQPRLKPCRRKAQLGYAIPTPVLPRNGIHTNTTSQHHPLKEHTRLFRHWYTLHVLEFTINACANPRNVQIPCYIARDWWACPGCILRMSSTVSHRSQTVPVSSSNATRPEPSWHRSGYISADAVLQACWSFHGCRTNLIMSHAKSVGRLTRGWKCLCFPPAIVQLQGLHCPCALGRWLRYHRLWLTTFCWPMWSLVAVSFCFF